MHTQHAMQCDLKSFEDKSEALSKTDEIAIEQRPDTELKGRISGQLAVKKPFIRVGKD